MKIMIYGKNIFRLGIVSKMIWHGLGVKPLECNKSYDYGWAFRPKKPHDAIVMILEVL